MDNVNHKAVTVMLFIRKGTLHYRKIEIKQTYYFRKISKSIYFPYLFHFHIDCIIKDVPYFSK